MKLNAVRRAARQPEFTHEGAPAVPINAEQRLRRSVMACMLWEDEFYEDGQTIAQRIVELVPQCRPDFVAACAYHARTDMKLRHVPLLLVREMARHPKHKALVAALLPDVIQRADEITEFLAIYWKDKRQPLSAQVKRGLAAAFAKFSEYDLAKYDRDGPVKLRDAMFLCHAKPVDGAEGYNKEWRRSTPPEKRKLNPHEALYERVVNRKLATPVTWETELSSGKDKFAAWAGLLKERKLGALAFLRNLRNMTQAGISPATLAEYSKELKVDRVLPYRFVAAARVMPQLEPVLEPLMMKCLEGQEKFSGRTLLLVDISGSMDNRLSAKSDMKRVDAACGLAILARELFDDVTIASFSDRAVVVPPRRGFALRDAILTSQMHGGTNLRMALAQFSSEKFDRIIVITDEQSATRPSTPDNDAKGYVINVASNRSGVGYGAWTHIDGWSEAVLAYIRELEKEGK